MSALRTLPRLSRAVATAGVQRQAVRFAHFENEIDHTLPFQVTNRFWLAFKISAYSIVGFGLPFYAVHWHLEKAKTG